MDMYVEKVMISALLLCCVMVSPVAAAEPVGLFVGVIWRKLEGNESSSCDNCDHVGCLPSQYFWVESDCRRRAIRLLNNLNGSESVFPINETHFCRKYYNDNLCEEESPLYAVEAANGLMCNEIKQITACPDEDPTKDGFLYMPDYCVESDVPMGDFNARMIDRYIYFGEESCETGDVHQRAEAVFPAEPSYCFSIGVPIQNSTHQTSILGGGRSYCDSEGRQVLEHYTDAACSEQGPELLEKELVWDGCYDPQTPRFPEQRGAVDCEKPRYHCKDLAKLDFIVATSPLEGSAGDTEEASSATAPRYSIEVVISLIIFIPLWYS
ncbi:expressed unknown protein [Seminavis robusta]|uniref:Uncharacterized protein n=1 Tax=Seminavis robusta TaxID=568900 RepID=A0A9N8EEH6_9STRA|nr:expressed unknown protein [Seminavis robusta]|eukprot:Sro881_g215250.1 n/a (324) ;mRNA; f:26067-27038